MAKLTESDLVKFGEPLRYDKTFKGPLSKRSCTDIICLLIFVVFLAGWGFVSYYAFTNGDFDRLLTPTDSQNRICGVDSQVREKPYLFFFNLEKCIDPLVPIVGCPTPQVCVEKCPSETFILDKDRNVASLKAKIICQTDEDRDGIASYADAEAMVKAGRCARWHTKSKPFLNRCVWEFSSTICEYIPGFLLDRSKRDLTQPSYYKNSMNLTTQSDDLKEYRISDDRLDLPEAVSNVIFPTDGLKIYDQKKQADEPVVECETRKKLGEQIIVEKMKKTNTYLARFIGNIVVHFSNSSDAQQVGQEMVEDITSAWIPIVVALLGAMVVSLIFIFFMRWLATPLVWLSIVGVLAMLGYGIYFGVTQYIFYRDNVVNTNASINLQSWVQSWFRDKSIWLYLTIALSVIFLVIFLMVVFLRERIVIATALIKEGSKAVSSVISTVFFPICPWVLHVLAIGFAVAVGLYLASVGESQYQVIGMKDSTQCKCSGSAINYKDGATCDPDIFNENCYETQVSVSYLRIFGKNTAPCSEAGCFFVRIASPKIIGYFHAINVIGFFWLAFFITAFGEMVLAATFATWYWTFHKSDVPYFTLTGALWRTVRYHLGTLAFGSLIVTICRLIRVVLEYIDSKLKKYDNPLTRCILCCMKCFFWALERFLRFINKNAYIMCAIHGKSFCSSAKDAFNLLMRNCLRVVTLDKVTDFVFFLSKLLITLAVGTATYYYADRLIEPLHYAAVPTAIVVVGTYLITCVFFSVYSMAVDTLFLCFLEDSERNDGSAEKPFFMSKRLMKILGKRNEVPRHRYE